MVFKVKKLTARVQNKQKSISQSKDSEWPFSVEQLKYVSKTGTHSILLGLLACDAFAHLDQRDSLEEE